MFDNLSDRLNGVFRKLGGRAQLDEKNIQEGLREVRLALLEADVNFKVVKEFTDKVRERCLGVEVGKSLTPTQQLVSVVNEELTAILGGETEGLNLRGKAPHAIMLVGLQGSGKTTSAAKLANWLKGQGHRPYLAPADVYRPAAIEQLATLAEQLELPCYPSSTSMKPVDIALKAMDAAREADCDVVLLDTAGRLHIDQELMDELVALKDAAAPKEILFVADAMTGQEAVTVAEAFDKALDISGVILTKMDGDARGGAALSIKSVTGKSVKFVGLGEKISEMEIFHPDRVAGRILGMGDVLTLIEKTQGAIEQDEAEELARKMQKAEFDFEDFRVNMRRIKKLGSLDGILKMIPGLGGLREKLGAAQTPEKELARTEAIINSMTRQERHTPKIINAARKSRIAKGAGVTVAQVNQLLKQFEAMRGMMQNMMGGKGKAGKGLPRRQSMPGLPGGRMPGLPGGMGGLGGMSGMPGLGGMSGMPGLSGLNGSQMPEEATGGALSKTAQKKKKQMRKAQRNKKR
ncbi:MAG: signal recognition particle protein [Deltaproteobacteria bacterium]|jgi:signal recognition particle subunit SRP54|nr:signal recognition particle protein [Deltaproteobacteria bacterium]